MEVWIFDIFQNFHKRTKALAATAAAATNLYIGVD